ncbi:hypothetical protein PQ459_00400 [Chryseobacterium sp. KACC 21268]|nr:hypothetical protein PQ459_00400 [Chryseobacterium sp. KACC 21268]
MNIIISPIFKQFFSGRIWMGLDIDSVKIQLESTYDANVHIIPFSKLRESLENIPIDSVLFYSSVYNIDYLKFIQDTILYISLKRPDIVLIPNQHQLNSLENKGYQELYKDLLGIEKVFGTYYGDIDELCEQDNVFPFVLKKLKGALSSGVQLIYNKKELDQFRDLSKKKTLKEKAAFHLNKRNSFKKDFNLSPVNHLLDQNFKDVFTKRIPVVVQEFVPGLECDFKVLIFGDKFFAVRRGIRDNDFRASGSGKLKWTVPPTEVLNFAKNLKIKFNVPFISLDIGIDKTNTCFLFEYQGTAFGPATLTNGDKYFFEENGVWLQKDGDFVLEEEYAYAINHFVNENT